MSRRILLACFKQETSSFNPALTGYDDFQTCAGADVRRVLGAAKDKANKIVGAIVERAFHPRPAKKKCQDCDVRQVCKHRKVA